MQPTAFSLDLPSTTQQLPYAKLPISGTALSLTHTALAYHIPLFVIVASPEEAIQLQRACQFFNPTLPCFIFPAWETLPYDHFSPHQEIVSQRLLTLKHLPELTEGIVIAPIHTLLERLAPKSYLAEQVFSLAKGQKFHWQTMRAQCQLGGYRSVHQVTLPGEYAVRGSLFDIFPSGAKHPFRIDLFGDEIDSIKAFDPETQRSFAEVSTIELLPAHEFPLNEAGVKNFRQNFREQFSVNPANCPLYESISRFEAAAGIEYYLALFFDHTASIFDYLPSNTLTVAPNNWPLIAKEQWQNIHARYEQLSHDVTRPILPSNQVFLSIDDLHHALKKFSGYVWVDPQHATTKQLKYLKTLPLDPLPDLHMQAHLADPLAKLRTMLAQNTSRTVLFCAETQGRLENFLTLLKPLADTIQPIHDWQNFTTQIGKTAHYITVAPLEAGCMLGHTALIIPEAALLGNQVMQSRKRKSRHFDSDLMIRNLAELCPGDPIVHIDHGIGRYQGLEILHIGDHEGEFLKILYDGGNVYVPVGNMHLISRYNGVDTEHAPLHRLGGDAWEKAKRKAAEQVRDVAAELLTLYAARAAQKGFSHSKPDEHYHAFAAAFPFAETQGQTDAIHAVLQNMTAEKPMDRLICGDVGFGKTEVAMRAAFLAVQSGTQVVILVPTTLLAAQHYESFCNRFAKWPIKIAVLSRFQNAGEQKKILAELATGHIDIIIGTHKLLSPSLCLHHLGLLVIDEEHRFGVRQKEALKKWRTHVDTLTMTATPIPRSLNMAMAAMRDLSIIASPPAKRLAIKTFVREWDWPLVREAIQREIARGGQVYFLHNEVASIERMADELRTLVPQARVEVAHGQLHERSLEQMMADFYHQRFNVLVCSTIIETGIDVPNANTIIIHRADKFGLAQLHQLRGRVGRSHHQAYAYLFTPPPALLSVDAKKRLEAIESLEELGAGFMLATHDLEIRGAGELLGENQSGHIQAIGYTLYTELLDRTIKAMQKGALPNDPISLLRSDQTSEIELQLPAFIPDQYIPDINLRLIFYKRMAMAENESALRELKIELIDRFGVLPTAAENLFKQMQLKWILKKLGIKRIEANSISGRIEFLDNTAIDPRRIIALIQTKPKEFKLEGPNRLKFFWPNEIVAEQRIAAVEKLLVSFGD